MPLLIVPLAYLLLALIFTWPLLPEFFSAIPTGLPDSYQNIWNFWWMRTALFEQHSNPYYTGMLFYPYRGKTEPLPLYFQTLQPALSVPGGLLSYLLGYGPVYNLLLLGCYAGTGWATYALARLFLRGDLAFPRLAAFAAGLFYAFAPYHQHSILLGQTQVFSQQWIPLYLFLLHKTLDWPNDARREAGQRPLIYASLAALSLWLCFLTELYYFVYLVLYSAAVYLFLSFNLWRKKGEGKSLKTGWLQLTLRLSLIGVVALVLASPVLWGMLRSGRDSTIILQDSLVEDVVQSTTLDNLFLPSNWTLQGWKGLYLGFSCLLLAAAGFWRGWKERRSVRWWWAGVFVVCAVLSLGPFLRFSGDPPVDAAAPTGIPLPYLLFHSLPLLGFSRSPIRFLALATLALSLLAAWGAADLANLVRRPVMGKIWTARFRPAPGVLLSGLFMLVFVLEVVPVPLKLDNLYYPKILDDFARDPDPNFGLLELPITTHYTRDNRRMFFQAVHHHPITSGYTSRRVNQLFGDDEPLGRFFGRTPFPAEPTSLDQNQTQAALKTLQLYRQLYDFRYVMFYKDEYGNDQKTESQTAAYLDKTLGADSKIFDDGRTAVYRIPPSSSDAFLLINVANGYDAQKLGDGQVYRWGRQRLVAQIVASRELKVQISFIAWSLPPDNSVEIRLDGNPPQTLKLAQSPQSFSINVRLKPGRNFLEFNSIQAGNFPQALNLPFSDERKLAIAVGEFRITEAK